MCSLLLSFNVFFCQNQQSNDDGFRNGFIEPPQFVINLDLPAGERWKHVLKATAPNSDKSYAHLFRDVLDYVHEVALSEFGGVGVVSLRCVLESLADFAGPCCRVDAAKCRCDHFSCGVPRKQAG